MTDFSSALEATLAYKINFQLISSWLENNQNCYENVKKKCA